MADFGSAQVDQVLTQMRRTLDAMRSDPAAAPDEEDRTAVGEAAEGQVRAVMRDGRLESLRLDPRMMRLASEDLCEQVVTAVNAALAEARRRNTAAMPATVDPAVLAGQLREMHDASVREMSAFGAAMNDVLARMGQAGGER